MINEISQPSRLPNPTTPKQNSHLPINRRPRDSHIVRPNCALIILGRQVCDVIVRIVAVLGRAREGGVANGVEGVGWGYCGVEFNGGVRVAKDDAGRRGEFEGVEWVEKGPTYSFLIDFHEKAGRGIGLAVGNGTKVVAVLVVDVVGGVTVNGSVWDVVLAVPLILTRCMRDASTPT